MKIDYNKLKSINYDSTLLAYNNVRETMPCYFLIQRIVEKFLEGETLNKNEKKNF